jgi:adenylosuccinate synthase
MTRSGLRMCDLFDEQIFETKLRRLAAGFQKRYGDLLKYNVDEEIAQYKVSHDGVCSCDAKTNNTRRLYARSSLPMSSTRSHSSHRPRRRTPRSW